MISETDIQIGDWLHLEYTNSIKGFVSFNFKVSQLRRDYGDELLVWGEKTPDGKHFGNMGGVSKIQPIPLTAEILEKNGFENDFYEEESVADYHTIRLEGYSLRHNIGEADGYLVTWCNGGINVTTDLNGCVQKDVSYVHELQHALRLCGIEHEITL